MVYVCGSVHIRVYTGDRSPVGPSNALRNERIGVESDGGSKVGDGSGAVVAGMAQGATWCVRRVRNETFRLFVPQGIYKQSTYPLTIKKRNNEQLTTTLNKNHAAFSLKG
jgi:hypothetical protein